MRFARLTFLAVFLALGGCSTYRPLVDADRRLSFRGMTSEDYAVLEASLRYYIKDRNLTGETVGVASGSSEQLTILNSRLGDTGVKLLPASHLVVTPHATRRETPLGPDLWVLDISIVWKDGDERTVRVWDYRAQEEQDFRVIILAKRSNGSWKAEGIFPDAIE